MVLTCWRANGARVRLAPQKTREVNEPTQLAKVWKTEAIQAEFNAGGSRVSLADLIVLAGNAAVEEAAKKAGIEVSLSFTSGRMDASQDQTDVDSFGVLEPMVDGFRNFAKKRYSVPTESLLVDRAQLLTLIGAELTALIGGLRVLGANHGQSKHGVFTDSPETLSNDFFVNLLDMSTKWSPVNDEAEEFEGCDRAGGDVKWTATRADLIFGSNSTPACLRRGVCLFDSKEKFVQDFLQGMDQGNEP